MQEEISTVAAAGCRKPSREPSKKQETMHKQQG